MTGSFNCINGFNTASSGYQQAVNRQNTSPQNNNIMFIPMNLFGQNYGYNFGNSFNMNLMQMFSSLFTNNLANMNPYNYQFNTMPQMLYGMNPWGQVQGSQCQQTQQTQQTQAQQGCQQASQTNPIEKNEPLSKEDVAKINKEQEKKAANRKEAAAICDELYLDMKGIGTRETLPSNVKRINKDNVLEVLDIWKEHFSDAMDGESLIESINNDVYSSDRQRQLIGHIKDAMVQRAEEMGYTEDAKSFDAKVKGELRSIFNISDVFIEEQFDLLHQKLSQADSYNYFA